MRHIMRHIIRNSEGTYTGKDENPFDVTELIKITLPITELTSLCLTSEYSCDLVLRSSYETWLNEHNVNWSDLYVSVYYDPRYDNDPNILIERLLVDFFFKPEHQDIALLFKLTFGGK